MADDFAFINKLIGVIKLPDTRTVKDYLNSLDCLCRIVEHATESLLYHPLHAFTPLLDQLIRLTDPRESSQAGDNDSREVQLERQLILTSLVYLLKRVSSYQTSDDMTNRAPELFSTLLRSFTDKRPGKQIDTAQSMGRKLGKEKPPFWWLPWLHRREEIASMPPPDEQQEPSRPTFTRKDGATDTINLLADCITAGLKSE